MHQAYIPLERAVTSVLFDNGLITALNVLKYFRSEDEMNKLAALSFALALLFAQAASALAADSAENTNTGPGSENTSSVERSNQVKISISNTAKINYDINMNLNTGGNTVSHNTTAGDLVSGDIGANISLKTVVNQEDGLCDGCLPNLGGGSASASNEKTGPNSKNEATVAAVNKLSLNVKNKADVNYKLNLEANTGGNTCSYNTTVGDCVSGDIKVAAALETEINQGGVGGAEDKDKVPPADKDQAKAADKAAEKAAPPPAVGGALFAAGSSLLILFALLVLAANCLYFLSRHPKFAFHFLNEGKVAKSKR